MVAKMDSHSLTFAQKSKSHALDSCFVRKKNLIFSQGSKDNSQLWQTRMSAKQSGKENMFLVMFVTDSRE